ncbi:hypothetical protein BSZ39_10135 [Bowdeniella nasicola]|uniref:Multiple sugar transport system substrate-binding protein n=1 Tax=Bowdeniella nasicola TaxID=208480 RepID=A0A1Q5Q0J4_9ACTO|nr:substrate-binding domain-containing protein [Bowdeniella nasicola]OKL53327.1 hypothetical protein BSZ39_10135 [Bowdeniella nasicola]
MKQNAGFQFPEMDRRSLLKFTGVVGAMAALAACTPKESGGTETSGSGTAKLEFLWPGTSDPETAVANDFKKAISDKGIDLEYNFLSWADMQKQISVRVQAQDPPDLTMTQDVSDWVRMGALADLTERFGSLKIDRDKFRPGTLEYSEVDGKLFALPYSAQSWTLVANEELFEKAGLDLSILETYEGMQEAATKLTGDGKYGFCIPMQNPRFSFRTFATAAYANGFEPGSYANPETAKWVETLEHLKAFNELRPAADKAWAYPEMFRAFANGEVAMVAAGSFFTANVYELNPEIVAKSVQLPYPKGPQGSDKRVPISNAGFAAFGGSENLDKGWEALSQLMDAEWMARLTAVAHAPALSSVSTDDLKPWVEKYYPKAVEGHLKQCESQAKIADENGIELKKIPGQPAIEPEFSQVFSEFLGGSMSAEDAVSRMGERFAAVAQ